MKEEHKQIVAECLDAVDCARAGNPHPRLNGMIDRTIDEMERRAEKRQIVKGGLMPPTVEHHERRERVEYPMTFDEPRYGIGGNVKSD